MPQSSAASPLIQLFPLVLIFAIFYFLLIRPQKQKEKEHQKMLAGVNKNDEIVTLGGIHGTVVNVKEKTITLRIDENVKMEIEKSSVAYIKNPKSA
ncbi:MAG: preprotein translocase subunit YajC [Candidatus Omnitrophica bacterium]|jgi:preprotein translocase subunit YajC|nr:preprotein translocase subunit YajC [Candidatus Omnitrophota bacterium]MDD5252993.1 preprotein translocase subunit YajC [Candidatus Omnitrophota bacterium]